ncbi:MAG: HDOD domain-containing protein, partial [Verrucomicrobia bacterium]|nr:HDOD domain-containing protein [Verrucomicrobiota bacterium]
EEKSMSEVEIQCFGIHHLDAGYLIAEKWKLPDNIKHTIKHHNDGKIGGEYDEQVACIHLADTIANILELGVSAVFTVQRPDPELWEFLEVEPGIIESLYPEIMDAYTQSVSISLSSG